ncbi:hypothetical protein LRS06_20555 [Hymenobacter sp. J193]|uniref:hypothetical protein n=1 Tax=Hymenobacter sp. J193 TaxID=2898429 RepID=UPI00215089B1|nr:hypothetical protein [Hymenobacter sp. J193]MCR5890121.1 hypothetical protein [Hymenobacter sp. J193]
MPKTIDYPRTSYTSAWEVAEVVDDTGGKCALETTARKLNRKVSGSFKAIVGSAVKFGLLTSKREFLTTTNLFRRIKHAYDKQEEKIYHREAFLHPPLFTQICRKFRNRELPVHMLDVMLIREFGVEEINAQNVAKAFIDGARMVDILDEQNTIADIDQLTAQQGPRRELAAGDMPLNIFRGPRSSESSDSAASRTTVPVSEASTAPTLPEPINSLPATPPLVPSVEPALDDADDPVSALFNLPSRNSGVVASSDKSSSTVSSLQPKLPASSISHATEPPITPPQGPVYPNPSASQTTPADLPQNTSTPIFRIQLSGPGLHTDLTIQDATDLAIVQSLLEKIRRQVSHE